MARAIPVLPLVGSTIDRFAADQLALGFGGADHRRTDPVLDRSAGIEVLELGADLGVELRRPIRASETSGVPPTVADACGAIK